MREFVYTTFRPQEDFFSGPPRVVERIDEAADVVVGGVGRARARRTHVPGARMQGSRCTRRSLGGDAICAAGSIHPLVATRPGMFRDDGRSRVRDMVRRA